MQSSSSMQQGPKFASTPIKAAASPVNIQRKTPAEFSDYSSEVDERFRSVSRTYESDSDIKGYRVVYPPTPTPTPRSNVANGHKSPVVVVTPSPMEFEPHPPSTSFPPPKFEPIKKEIRHEIKTESHQQNKQSYQQQQQTVYKPKPVAAKFLAAAQQQQQQYSAPPTQGRPTMYYNAIAGTPLHMANMATETHNVMQMKESSETCQRVVNMQQTKRVIHFDTQNKSSETVLEPFPYTAAPSSQRVARQPIQTAPTPTKFIPGEFRESDYESEVENARINALWSPRGEFNAKGYRHVEPPHPGRACSLPRSYERVLSPMEFDRGPEMPTKIKVDINSLRREQRGGGIVTTQHKTQSLNRHSSMRNTNYAPQSLPVTLPQPSSFPRDDMNLKVGSPPRYGYIQNQADMQAKSMTSTFLQKSHQFVSDITKDLNSRNSGVSMETKTVGFRAGFKRAPSEGDNKPQAYRDESRVSQYGKSFFYFN